MPSPPFLVTVIKAAVGAALAAINVRAVFNRD